MAKKVTYFAVSEIVQEDGSVISRGQKVKDPAEDSISVGSVLPEKEFIVAFPQYFADQVDDDEDDDDEEEEEAKEDPKPSPVPQAKEQPKK